MIWGGFSSIKTQLCDKAIKQTQQHHWQTKKEKENKFIILFFPGSALIQMQSASQSYYLEVTKMLISINNIATTQFKLWQVIDDVCPQDIWWSLTLDVVVQKK